jgi:hypothetical protein
MNVYIACCIAAYTASDKRRYSLKALIDQDCVFFRRGVTAPNLKISGNTSSANERFDNEQINSAETSGHALRNPVGMKSNEEPLSFNA